MKVLLFLCVILIGLGQAESKCRSGQLTVQPKENELQPNSCLMIEGYGTQQKFIESLADDMPFFLESDSGEQIELNLINYNQGGFRINQSILQPKKSLVPGNQYTLVFKNPTSPESIPQSLNPEETTRSWMVQTDTPSTPIKLMIEPKFIQAKTQFFGCGPAANAEFEFITDSNTPTLVKTEVMDITDGTTQRYFIKTTHKNTLEIGHGMCSGAFSYKPKHEYQARFSIMNDCNTQKDNWTDWVEFENPFQDFE